LLKPTRVGEPAERLDSVVHPRRQPAPRSLDKSVESRLLLTVIVLSCPPPTVMENL